MGRGMGSCLTFNIYGRVVSAIFDIFWLKDESVEDSAFSKAETLKAEGRQKSFGWDSGRYITKLVEPTRSAGHHL
jgi:hypothetical protein